MKTYVGIPARMGSSRFPGKSLALIHGKTMIERVWDKCKKSKEAQEVIVATDSIKNYNSSIKTFVYFQYENTYCNNLWELIKPYFHDFLVQFQDQFLS